RDFIHPRIDDSLRLRGDHRILRLVGIARPNDDRAIGLVRSLRGPAITLLDQLDGGGSVITAGTANNQRQSRWVVAQRVELLRGQHRNLIFVHTSHRNLIRQVRPFALGNSFEDQVHQQSALVAALNTELTTEVTKLTKVTTADAGETTTE